MSIAASERHAHRTSTQLRRRRNWRKSINKTRITYYRPYRPSAPHQLISFSFHNSCRFWLVVSGWFVKSHPLLFRFITSAPAPSNKLNSIIETERTEEKSRRDEDEPRTNTIRETRSHERDECEMLSIKSWRAQWAMHNCTFASSFFVRCPIVCRNHTVLGVRSCK